MKFSTHEEILDYIDKKNPRNEGQNNRSIIICCNKIKDENK